MIKKFNLIAVAILATISTVAASAQLAPSVAPMPGAARQNQLAMREDMAAMKTMSVGMMSAKGSTADITFARKMLAHHQGAIDMARIELKHGSDAEAKRMAQQIIDEQTKGKADLEAFLRAHGG